ncbi:MAG: hypothetical protein ACREXI_03775, partial [Caldimonas sp.]
LQLRADTTLQTNTGDVTLQGAVDGAFDLTLASGATTRISGPLGATTPLRSLTTDNNPNAADWNGSAGERTLFDVADAGGRARVITTGAQTYADPVVANVPLALNGGAITADQATNRFDLGIAADADTMTLHGAATLRLDDVTLAHGGRIEADGVLQLAGALHLTGGTLVLLSNAVPTASALTDPEFQGRTLTFGFAPLQEASATIVQGSGSTVASSVGSLLVLRTPQGGSIRLDQPGNTLLGTISAVSGSLGDNSAARFNAANITLGFIRIDSSEIHADGAPPADANQALQQAGIEGDVLRLATDVLSTGPTGQLRARLPFNNTQGSQTSMPGITFVLGAQALAGAGAFGTGNPDGWVQVRVGSDDGGFLTVRPKGAGASNVFVLLGGRIETKPFYDGSGKLTEVRVFYNGDAPRTPQETGALAAVTAVIEDARHARFEEAVRTENVASRLRSGVIAEVGAGRPATVGRESIRPPPLCDLKPGTLRCE